MDELLALLILVVVAVPLTLVVLIIAFFRLRRRVQVLEVHLAQHQTASVGADTEVESAPEEAAGDLAAVPEVTKPGNAAETDQPRPNPWGPTGVAAQAKRSSEHVSTDIGSDTPAPKAVVFRASRVSGLFAWLKENWFYAVSALSLALAGIFLVQYGVENGLLPPEARVLAAFGFGALLILAGEFVRRRFGDGESSSTAYLPSVFSGAGLVTLFGALLSARQLYDLIGPEAALAGMVAVALLGMVLGWFHGPLLAAVGLIGAFAAPFMVGGSSEDPAWLFGYFLIVALLGLCIDTVRRWAWVSVLTLTGAYLAAWMLAEYSSGAGLDAGMVSYCAALALLAIIVPGRALVPVHSGSMISSVARRSAGDRWPNFPTRLAFGSMAVSVFLIARRPAGTEAMFWLAVLILAGLTLAMILWARRADALQDVTALPAVGLLFVVFIQGSDYGAAASAFRTTYFAGPEADYPFLATVLVALATVISLFAARRSSSSDVAVFWAGGAVLFAPVMAIVLELAWTPAEVIGAYEWGLHALALGALMVLLATRFAREDGEDRMRAALATLSALSCLAFACVVVLSSAALTVALAVTVAVATALDRRFNLPPMGWFVTTGVVVLGFRLVVEPGLWWAENAPLSEMVLAYGGTLAAFLFGFWQLRRFTRPTPSVMLESAAWSTAGLLLSLLLMRWLNWVADAAPGDSHWALGLASVIWLGLGFAQVQRMSLGGRLAFVRKGLAGIFGLIGLALLAGALSEGNPLLILYADPVLGPPVFNTLAVAYLLPALILAISAWRIETMLKILRNSSFAAATLLAAFWLGMAIRHIWQGADGMHESNGVSQPELYTYTITLLLIGAALFYQSFAIRSDMMRKAGLAVIGLAVAKVFLIDIAGLGGLIRVFSLLALGLSLAALAWLNRWAMMRLKQEGAEPLDQ
ncbi:MAG: DUF2339 domain-containing protein [Paracoccaceae bacterium]